MVSKCKVISGGMNEGIRILCSDSEDVHMFYVPLNVHLGIILFKDQLDAQFYFVYVYFSSLHVSSIQVLIIRRFNCINTISGICHSGRLVCRFGRNQFRPNLHARHSPT